MSSGNGSMGLDIGEENVSVVPTDPYEQVDVDAKITKSIMAFEKVESSSEVERLRKKLHDKDLLIADLQHQLSQLQHAYRQAQSRFNNTPPHINNNDNVDHTSLSLEVAVDTTDFFMTEQVFDSREEVIEWAKKSGHEHGVVVVVLRSDVSNAKRTPRVMLGCYRSGGYRYRGKLKRPDVKRPRLESRKCDCPFRLRVSLVNRADGRWSLDVINGSHNHTLVEHFEEHSFMDGLHKDGEEILEGMPVSGVLP